MNKIKNLIITFIFIFAAGCGYISDSPVEDSGLYVSDELQGCVIDPDSFGKILEKDIENQIDCLEKSLIQFSRYVRSDSKGSIGHGELSDFIKEVFKENSQTIIKGLGLIFELNMILMRDEATHISHSNITPLMKVLLKTNREAIIITNILREIREVKTKKRFYEERAKLKESLERFSAGLLEVLLSKKTLPQELHIKEFLVGLKDKLGTQIDEELVDSLIFIKRLFLGGDRLVVSSNEIITLINKAPSLLLSAFDMIYVKSDFMDSTNELITFYQDRIRDIESQVVELEESEEVFSIEELFKIARKVKDATLVSSFLQAIGIDEYEAIVLQFKEDMIGGDRKIVRYSELKTMFLYTQVLFEATKSLINIDDILKDLTDKDSAYAQDTKKAFHKEVRALIENLQTEIGDGSRLPENLYVYNFICEITKSIDKLNLDLNLINSGLSLKKIIVGGLKEVVTRKELMKTINDFQPYAAIYYDLAYMAPRVETNEELYRLAVLSMRKFESFLYPWEEDERLLHMDDISTIIKAIAPEIDVDKFKDAIVILKEKIISKVGSKVDPKDEEAQFFTAKEIKTLIQFLKEAVENVYFAEATYNDKKDVLELINVRMTNLEFGKIDAYRIFSKKQLEAQKANFVYILKNFRYFNSEDMVPYYDQKIRRTKDGFVFTTFLHWGFTKVADGYAKTNPKTGMKEIDMARLEGLLLDIKPLLEYFSLWSKNFQSFVRNCILLGDLFQSTSNGDFNLNVDEATEYVAMIFTAVGLANNVMDQLDSGICKNIGDEETKIFELDCYRDNFFDILFNKMGYAKYFSKLKRYDDEATKEDGIEYLKAVERFARDVDPSNPMGIRDFTLVIGAMLNIETTFIRYDLNNDNSLDLDELKEAFKVYKRAIMDIANLKGWKERFALPAFLYMVKEMEKPGFFDLLQYLNPWYKVDAKRINIGALLAYLVSIPQEQAMRAEKSNGAPPTQEELEMLFYTSTYDIPLRKTAIPPRWR